VDLVGHVDDKKAKAVHEALKAIREDRAAFKHDPKGKVPDLDDDAVAVFKTMSDPEYDCLLLADEKMEEAGFAIGSGNFSVRMV
jgi:hypothetical protein